MAQKPASDMLPAASGVLPVKAQVVRLPVRPNQGRGAQTRVNITKASLARLLCPPGKAEAFYWDAEAPGLALRAYASGKRVWLVQYRDEHGRTRRMPLGNVGVVDPADARRAARETLAKVAGGANPATERKAARLALSVGDLVEAYLAHAERGQRAATFDQTRRNLRKYSSSLHGDAVAAVDRLAVYKLHQRIGGDAGQVQANRALATLSAMWVWALRSGLATGDNPCALVPKFAETARERVLAADELRSIWWATEAEGAFNRIVRLLLLTACRRSEIGGMQWGELEGDLLVVPAARMKRARPHEVPLSALALEQLPARVECGGAVFSKGGGFEGWSAAKARLDTAIAAQRAAEAGIELPNGGERKKALEKFALPSWGLHDFRRTFSTIMNERALAEPHVIEAVLAHQGAQSGIAGIYNRAAYRDAKRAALAAWAAVVAEVVR